MSRNRTVCFRGNNLESIDKKAKEKGIKPNELINIAVEKYLSFILSIDDLTEFLRVNTKSTAQQILKHLEDQK